MKTKAMIEKIKELPNDANILVQHDPPPDKRFKKTRNPVTFKLDAMELKTLPTSINRALKCMDTAIAKLEMVQQGRIYNANDVQVDVRMAVEILTGLDDGGGGEADAE